MVTTDVYRCPCCGASVTQPSRAGFCADCRAPFTVRHERLIDFIGADDRDGGAEGTSLLGWPDEFVRRFQPWLVDLYHGRPVPQDAVTDMAARGIVTGDSGKLTGLGKDIAYHLLEYVRQMAGDGIAEGIRSQVRLRSDDEVLDIGCGAGQSLRLLAPDLSLRRVGVDIDLGALALGCRLDDAGGGEIDFVRCSAHSLPFASDRFAFAMSRVALNYVNQRRAVIEMARVLRPGGWLYCRVEGLGHDLRLLGNSRGGRRVAACVRDLGLGLANELLGWQPMRGDRLRAGRSFATARSISAVLRAAGCDVCRVETSLPCWGLPKRIELLARKRV